MYEWVSDETWLILGIISLIAYIFKGIEFGKDIFCKENRIIWWAIGISLFQIILSAIKVYGVLLELERYISNAFYVYGAIFILKLFFGKESKATNTDKILVIISLLCIIGALLIKYIA